MEQGLVERIRAAYASFNERGTVEGGLFADDVEWHNAPEFPGASVHRGLDAVRRDMERQQEAWGEARYDPTEIIPVGDDRYVVLLDVRVRGKASGAWASLEGGHLLTLRDGKVTQVRAFIHKDQALAAAGLRP